MHGVGADFCPLGGLVQGDGYGRRPPGRSPGRAPRRGALPAAEQRGPAAGLLRPAQAVKRESDPAPPPCCPPCPLPCPAVGVCAAGVGVGFCPLGGLVQGDGYGRRPPGRSPGRAPLRGASPLRSSGGPAAGLLRPAQAVKRESDPVPRPGKAPALFKSTCPIYR